MLASGTARLGKVFVMNCSSGMLSAVLTAEEDLIAKEIIIGSDTKSSTEMSAVVAGGYAQVGDVVNFRMLLQSPAE